MKRKHCVILRDDDTNALTPVECLETLYRPFLERSLPVHLAVIPEVRTSARTPEGKPEGFLFAGGETRPRTVSIQENPALIDYLRTNRGLKVVQHGLHHDTFEFDSPHRIEMARRLDRGLCVLREAGLDPARAFVAPHDKFSPVSFEEVARRFAVISTGWFEWRRLPRSWKLPYLAKKIFRKTHWQVGRIRLLTHPGCILSCHHSTDGMLDRVKAAVKRQPLTVLVTHWWEYFRKPGRVDEPFVRVLHETAEFLAGDPEVEVIRFDDLVREGRALN